ncbi:MAG: sialate O-acetylesterase [Ruminococcaceae bacterium]|nr:sialate O-acetylesterase [Oscillospiraceae bacterium]
MMRALRLIALILAALCCIIPLSACRKGPAEEDAPVYLEMNTDYPTPDSLPDGQGKRVKVILLLGQSNATGCSINEYLKKGLDERQYERYAAGFESVLINYCLDDHNATSDGAFVKVDLTCGATDGFFGPEVGMAEVLSAAYPDETVMIIKYTMSGYSLHHHWLRQGERGSIYDAFLSFAKLHMDYLLSKNYDARIGAICWMQGESDTTDFKASHYYDNQTAFVSYLREDLAPYAEEGGIYFIDAGISNSPYCEPAYPAINEAKVRFSADSPQNLYFSTIDAGFTVHLEPIGDPDWGHYDALSELRLGQMFGHYIVQSYQMRTNE